MKVSALAGVVTYAVGLLTVNGYLSQFGLSDYPQLRTRFIVTGALTLVLITGLLLVVYVCWRFAQALIRPTVGFAGGFLRGAAASAVVAYGPFGVLLSTLESTDRTSTAAESSVKLYLALLASLTILLVLRSLSSATSLDGLFTLEAEKERYLVFGITLGFAPMALIVGLIIPAVLTLCVGLAVLALGSSKVETASRNTFEWARSHHAVVLRWIAVPPAISALILLVSLNGRILYPLIPDQFGGGAPKNVQLGFSLDNAKTAAGLEIPILPPDPPQTGARVEAVPATGRISEMVCLLFEGEDTYLIALPSHAVLKVDRTLATVVHVELDVAGPCLDYLMLAA